MPSPLVSDCALIEPSSRFSTTTYHLQFVLPKLLLPRLIEKGKLADMMDEDVSQDGQLRVQGGDLAVFRLERSTKAAERCGRVELCYFPFDLLRDELPLQI